MNKVLKHTKFDPILDKRVDMEIVDVEIVKPWINRRVLEITGEEDELLIEYIINQLEPKEPDPKSMQMNLCGFMSPKNARIFITELWQELQNIMNRVEHLSQANRNNKDKLKSFPRLGPLENNAKRIVNQTYYPGMDETIISKVEAVLVSNPKPEKIVSPSPITTQSSSTRRYRRCSSSHSRNKRKYTYSYSSESYSSYSRSSYSRSRSSSRRQPSNKRKYNAKYNSTVTSTGDYFSNYKTNGQSRTDSKLESVSTSSPSEVSKLKRNSSSYTQSNEGEKYKEDSNFTQQQILNKNENKFPKDVSPINHSDNLIPIKETIKYHSDSSSNSSQSEDNYEVEYMEKDDWIKYQETLQILHNSDSNTSTVSEEEVIDLELIEWLSEEEYQNLTENHSPEWIVRNLYRESSNSSSSSSSSSSDSTSQYSINDVEWVEKENISKENVNPV